MLKMYIAVGIGGIVGTVLRYLISLTFTSEHFNSFPWATLIVNITGALLLTFIVFQPYFIRRLSTVNFVALTTGLIGSYTTFSTLMLEFTMLIQHDRWTATIYLMSTIFGGLFASFLGYIIAYKTNKSEAR